MKLGVILHRTSWGMYRIKELAARVAALIPKIMESASQENTAASASIPSRAHRQQHWNRIYESKGPQDVSWYQRRPDMSLACIGASGLDKDACILDVGGGESTLVDFLLDAGYKRLAVLDVSGVALNHSRLRLGARAGSVEWFEEDVISFVPPHRFDLWHDRAVFHFLTIDDDRRRYVATLRKTLQPGGTVILSTFATDGPPKCSGLDVMRWDEQSIVAELGAEFQLHEVHQETHITPWKSEQSFVCFRFQWRPARTLRGGGDRQERV